MGYITNFTDELSENKAYATNENGEYKQNRAELYDDGVAIGVLSGFFWGTICTLGTLGACELAKKGIKLAINTIKK